jgi:hypothetical protein
VRRDVRNGGSSLNICNIVDSSEAVDFCVTDKASNRVGVKLSTQSLSGGDGTSNGEDAGSLFEELWEESNKESGISGINAVNDGSGIGKSIGSIEAVEDLLEFILISIVSSSLKIRCNNIDHLV